MNRPLCRLLLAVLLAVCLPGAVPALRAQLPVQAPEPDRKFINSVLIGLRDGNYDTFTKFASPEFKQQIPLKTFTEMSERFSRRLKGGAELIYAGKMRRLDLPVYLYVIKFKDGGDDHLALVSVHDLEVAGLFVF